MPRHYRPRRKASAGPFTNFGTHSDGCVVGDGVWGRPCLALFQELQSQLPTLALRTSTDGCVVASCVRPYVLSTHGLQKNNDVSEILANKNSGYPNQ